MRNGSGVDHGSAFETDVPARLDRLPWSRFHWRVILALGITWILDGLEVTLAGSLASAISESPSLGLSATQVGLAASAYLVGAVAGALGFGWLADRFGRRRLFFITLLLYMVAAVATGLSWDFWSFAFFRMLTGAGIGGEYAAVNSAIHELMPARYRGRVDLAVNGSFWAGAALAAMVSLVVLQPTVLDLELGWRAAFVIGGLLAVIVLFLRRFLPESPRWLMLHGKPGEAEAVLAAIEADVEARHGKLPPVDAKARLWRLGHASMGDVAKSMLHTHRRRSVLGLVLMTCQAFCYNAFSFTYALVLTRFYGVPAADVGWFILPFALGNLCGPLLLGPLFDTIGRRPMITATYAISGLLMAATGIGFAADALTAWQLTACWSATFFFASAAASAAYLTVGESFPLEMRALAIALFFAIGTGMGGVAAPAVFGALIDTGSRAAILGGYILAAVLMLAASITAWRLGFAAEGRSLEEVAPPLAAGPR